MFGFFKKKKPALTENQRKHNKLWALWAADEIESPYKELMWYDSQVNNGGHDQYFFNMENTGTDLLQEMAVLEQVLSPILQQNIQQAHHAYRILDQNYEDEQAQASIHHCDDVFYENEQDILEVLDQRASLLSL